MLPAGGLAGRSKARSYRSALSRRGRSAAGSKKAGGAIGSARGAERDVCRGSGRDSARGAGGAGGASRSMLAGASAAASAAGRRGGRPRRGRGASSGAPAVGGGGAASLGAGADGASRYGLSSPPASGDGVPLVRLRRMGRLRSVIRKLRVVQWAPFRSERERDATAGMKTCNAMGQMFDACVGLEMREERGYCGSLWTGRVVPSHFAEEPYLPSGTAGSGTREQPAVVGGLVTRTSESVV